MSGLVPFLPFIQAAGAAVGAYGAFQAAQYQSAIAEMNAQVAQDNAAREREAADQDMQDRDTEARITIGELVASLGASGLIANQGSMLDRTESAQALADRDRERLGYKRDVAFENRMQEADAFRAQASAYKSQGTMGLLSGLIQIPTSYLSGAKAVNEYRGIKYGLTRPSYSRT